MFDTYQSLIRIKHLLNKMVLKTLMISETFSESEIERVLQLGGLFSLLITQTPVYRLVSVKLSIF